MKHLDIHLAEHLNNKLHVVAHFTYLTLVFVESHGFYGYAAGSMVVIMATGAGINKVINKKVK